jgi:hypothetical protein
MPRHYVPFDLHVALKCFATFARKVLPCKFKLLYRMPLGHRDLSGMSIR